MARRAVVGALVVGALAAVVAGRPSSAAPASLEAVPTAGTPLWSARRLPQPMVDAVGAANLQRALDATAAGVDGCFAVEVPGTGEVAQARATAPVIPASTQKILTSAAALSILGPDSTFTTRALATLPPNGGRVDALWLVGGGDPLLTTPAYGAALQTKPEHRGLAFTPFERLADEIVAAGVRSIPGGILGDDSAFSTPPYLAVWPESYRNEIGPLGALTVDAGIDPTNGQGVADPALRAATVLSELLTARGVAVGPPGRGTAPSGAAEIATLRSPPLRDMVTEMLSASDNLTAEALTLALGAKTALPGRTDAGVAAILTQLRTLAVDTSGLTLVDGSGLSRQDQLTCRALVQTLALGERPDLRALVDGLAIAGTRGTLTQRFVGTPLQGVLYAKTGTLSGVAGLTGLVADARRPRFATLFNGSFGSGGGIGLTTDAANAIGAFPQAPPADQLVPMPSAPRPRG